MELVEAGGNGFLADPNDQVAFAKALRSLLADHEDLQNARQASLLMAHRFDIRTVVDQYETILQKIVD